MNKYWFLPLTLLLFFTGISCKKSESCTQVRITSSAPGCDGWGILVNGVKYPSANIPTAFQQDNLLVCVTYSLYDDLRMCACCGGKWANIKSIVASH